MVNEGRFGSEEAIRCCHDCLSALSSSSSAGIRHSDIRPENIVYVTSGVKHPYFVLIGWGHAVLEDRDRPAMNRSSLLFYLRTPGREALCCLRCRELDLHALLLFWGLA
ncbi:unnamed protein product [Eruca vesicaria subsp. sativa]|uniref:Protein kinase domain-containing protein n=1 Tax=Eruca vesicaria subsp. sativa TaxID=29727 RepID=A0ABC8J0E3_ERUVS|nr:unnamed protein product [Eruca vesicaria subsp. sativa]